LPSGKEKYNNMMAHYQGYGNKLESTYNSIIPGFIENAIKKLDYPAISLKIGIHGRKPSVSNTMQQFTDGKYKSIF